MDATIDIKGQDKHELNYVEQITKADARIARGKKQRGCERRLVPPFYLPYYYRKNIWSTLICMSNKYIL